jgi:predicted flap endonuclease-1-like 5' DNA nuclease
MGDGMSGTTTSEGGWPAGWVIAAAAGVVAAILSRWMGAGSMPGAVLVGLAVFVVFGVLLGMFWAAPPALGGHAGHDDHGHGGHGHDDHGHDDHGHGDHGHDDHAHATVSAPVAAAPVAAPIAPAPVMAAAQPAPVVEAAPTVTSEAAATVEASQQMQNEGDASSTPVGDGSKPVGLAAARGGKGDDLQVLEGIGPAMEKLCHELGIFHFDQIASWGAAEVAWMDGNLKGFKGRVTRDKWVRQAALIGQVGIEEFKRRAKTNDY